MTQPDLIETFVHSQLAQGKTQSTVATRSRNLRRVEAALGSLLDLSSRRIAQWLEKQPYRPNTVRAYLDALSAFYEWAVQSDLLKADEIPTRIIEAPLPTRSTQPPLPTPDVERAIHESRGVVRCWIALSALQGLSCQSIANLDRENLDLAAQLPILRTRTRGRSQMQTNTLHPDVLEALSGVELPGRGRLFPDTTPSQISQRISRHLHKLSADGSAGSLVAWYRDQVRRDGEDFGRKSTIEPESPPSASQASIINALDEIVPSAANSYRQPLSDLTDNSRLSYRGTANELRSTLWDVLDQLAPDAVVEATPGFAFESNRNRPTMKQKGRHVFRTRRLSRSATEVPETSIDLVEERVGALSRAIYDRGSLATHQSAGRDETTRVLKAVELVLTELLQLTD